MGTVSFSTDGQRMSGEIIDDRGRLVVPAFSVPTSRNVKLPVGDYRVRLSSDGLLSETWPWLGMSV